MSSKKSLSIKDIEKSILLIFSTAYFVFKFLNKVNKYNLKKEFAISTLLLVGINTFYYIYGIYSGFFYFFILSILFSIIIYIIYWIIKIIQKDNAISKILLQEKEKWLKLSGWEFEKEVAKIFRAYGYFTTVTKGSNDGGVDIILKKDNIIKIVQCKHYTKPVTPDVLRALWGCKDDFNANGVILVASAGITQASKNFIQNKPNFEIYTLEDIIMLVKNINKNLE